MTKGPRAGWLSRLAPGVRKALSKREVPDDLWLRCPATGDMVYRPDLPAMLGSYLKTRRLGRERAA